MISYFLSQTIFVSRDGPTYSKVLTLTPIDKQFINLNNLTLAQLEGALPQSILPLPYPSFLSSTDHSLGTTYMVLHTKI